MLRQKEFEEQRSDKALAMLMMDRKNEFRELAETIMGTGQSSKVLVKDREIFVLNFCLDVNKAFKSWSGQIELPSNAESQSLLILRQLSRGQTTMNALAHLLNISYTLAEEFKVIYRRIQ